MSSILYQYYYWTPNGLLKEQQWTSIFIVRQKNLHKVNYKKTLNTKKYV